MWLDVSHKIQITMLWTLFLKYQKPRDQTSHRKLKHQCHVLKIMHKKCYILNHSHKVIAKCPFWKSCGISYRNKAHQQSTSAKHISKAQKQSTWAKHMSKSHKQSTWAKHICEAHKQSTYAKHICKAHRQSSYSTQSSAFYQAQKPFMLKMSHNLIGCKTQTLTRDKLHTCEI